MVFKTDYRLMQVKSIAECNSAILSTFIRLPFVFKTFVLSNFEWPLKTGFIVPKSQVLALKLKILIQNMVSCDIKLKKLFPLVAF